MMYTELQIHSELLDQPAFHGVPRKVFVCAPPRSGSFMLCRYMINGGIGVPAEYFTSPYIEAVAARFGVSGVESLEWKSRGRARRWLLRKMGRNPRAEFLQTYISHLLARRTRNQIFAAKIQYRAYRRILCNPIGWKLLDGSAFVHLYRRDIIASAISLHVAKITGKWGVGEDIIGKPTEADFFDASSISECLEDVVWENAGWHAFFAQHCIRPLSVAYEDLILDPNKILLGIADLLGIEYAALTLSYQEVRERPGQHPGIPSKSEIRRRFLADSRVIRPAEWPTATVPA